MEEGADGRRGSWGLAVAASVMLAACLPAAAAPVAEPPRAPVEASLTEETASAASPVEPEPAESTEHGTLYDCRGIRPASFRFPRPSDPATADLVAAAHPEDPGAIQPSSALSAALARAASLDPAVLSTFDRIVLQNTALGVTLRLQDKAGPDFQAAARTVERMALPAGDLDEMGTAPWTSLDLWIGPRDTWVDRKGESCGDGRLLFHDNVYRGTRHFRPMRVGNRRALVSQLVALDTQGHPHVTPAIGQIELRRGLGPGAAACIIELSPEALRDGDAGGLRPAELGELVTTPFVRHRSEGHLGCVTCHDGGGIGDFADVPSAERDLLRANRRSAAVHRLLDSMPPLFVSSHP